MTSFILDISEEVDSFDGEDYIAYIADLSRSDGSFVGSGEGDSEAEAIIDLGERLRANSTTL